MCPFINPEQVKGLHPWWMAGVFPFHLLPRFLCLFSYHLVSNAGSWNKLIVNYIYSYSINNTCLGYLSDTIRTDIHCTWVWVEFGWVLDFGETSLIYPWWEQTSLMWSLLLPLIIQTVGIYYTQTWPKSQLCHRPVSIIRTRLLISLW